MTICTPSTLSLPLRSIPRVWGSGQTENETMQLSAAKDMGLDERLLDGEALFSEEVHRNPGPGRRGRGRGCGRGRR